MQGRGGIYSGVKGITKTYSAVPAIISDYYVLVAPR